MKKFIIAALLGVVTLGATPSIAQPGYGGARIEHGVRTGQISRREANRLHRRADSGHYRGHGRMSRAERRRLDERRHHASRHDRRDYRR